MGIMAKLQQRIRELTDSEEIGCRENEQGELVCYYCGKLIEDTPSQLDHVIPRSKHGSNRTGNLVEACPRCNMKKFNRHPLTWADLDTMPDEVAIDFLARILAGKMVYGRWLRHTEMMGLLDYHHWFDAFLPVGYSGKFRFECPACGSTNARIFSSKALIATIACKDCENCDVYSVFIHDLNNIHTELTRSDLGASQRL